MSTWHMPADPPRRKASLSEVHRRDLARQFHEECPSEVTDRPDQYVHCICNDVHDTQSEADNERLIAACNANAARIGRWIAEARSEALVNAADDIDGDDRNNPAQAMRRSIARYLRDKAESLR